MWANPEFVPKWKTKDTSPEITSYTPTCIFPECHERKKLISPNEEERMSTTTAMWRHWMRSCWVSKMWLSSTEENPYS